MYAYDYTLTCMHAYIHNIYIYTYLESARELSVCVCVFKLIGTSSCLTSVWVYYTCVYIYMPKSC